MNLARFFVAIVPLIAAGQATNPALPSKEYIRLGSRVIAVENAPAPVALTAVANPTNFWPEGGNGTISITVVVAGTNWTAAVDASAASWLSISGPASGTGNGTVNFTVAANTGAPQRTGIIRVNSQTLNIMQWGAGAGPVTPINQEGVPSATFTFRIDTAGVSGVIAVEALFNWNVDGSNGCYFQYFPEYRILGLIADQPAAGYAGGIAYEEAGQPYPSQPGIQNSQCRIEADGSSVAIVNGVVTLVLPITFFSDFKGTQTVYTHAVGTPYQNWIAQGVWRPFADDGSLPVFGPLVPTSGAGSTEQFLIGATDSNGYKFLAFQALWFTTNTSASAANTCLLAFFPNWNQFFLVKDDGNLDWTQPYTPGPYSSSPTAANSACSVNPQQSTSALTLNGSSINYRTTFPSTAGGLLTAVTVMDKAGRYSSGWYAAGTWMGPAANFSVLVTPGTQTMGAGSSGDFTVTITPANNFLGTVTVSIASNTLGGSPTLSASSVTINDASSKTVTLTVPVPSGATPGAYELVIRGSWGGWIREDDLDITVPPPPPDFSLSAAPSPVRVGPGRSTPYTLTVTGVNGFAGPVSFSVSPTGPITFGFSPNPLNAGSGSVTVTVTAPAGQAPGSTTYTVEANGGGLTRTQAVTVEVPPNFSFTTPDYFEEVHAGSEATYTVTVGSNSFTATLTATALPFATPTVTPSSIAGNGNATVKITPPKYVATSENWMTARADNGYYLNEVGLQLNVRNDPPTLDGDGDAGSAWAAADDVESNLSHVLISYVDPGDSAKHCIWIVDSAGAREFADPQNWCTATTVSGLLNADGSHAGLSVEGIVYAAGAFSGTACIYLGAYDTAGNATGVFRGCVPVGGEASLDSNRPPARVQEDPEEGGHQHEAALLDRRSDRRRRAQRRRR
jgi:hypothetical protein